jgi:hypothetical protein
MKSRLERTAKMVGLNTVHPECIPFMLTALDHMLSAFIYKPETTTFIRHPATTTTMTATTTATTTHHIAATTAPTPSPSVPPFLVSSTHHFNGFSSTQLPRNIHFLPTPVDVTTSTTSSKSSDVFSLHPLPPPSPLYEDCNDNVEENYHPQEDRFTSPRMYYVPAVYLNNPASLAPTVSSGATISSQSSPRMVLMRTNVPNLVTKRDLLLTVQKRPKLEKLGENILTLRDALTFAQI